MAFLIGVNRSSSLESFFLELGDVVGGNIDEVCFSHPLDRIYIL